MVIDLLMDLGGMSALLRSRGFARQSKPHREGLAILQLSRHLRLAQASHVEATCSVSEYGMLGEFWTMKCRLPRVSTLIPEARASGALGRWNGIRGHSRGYLAYGRKHTERFQHTSCCAELRGVVGRPMDGRHSGMSRTFILSVVDFTRRL